MSTIHSEWRHQILLRISAFAQVFGSDSAPIPITICCAGSSLAIFRFPEGFPKNDVMNTNQWISNNATCISIFRHYASDGAGTNVYPDGAGTNVYPLLDLAWFLLHSPRSGFACRKTLRVSTTATITQIPAVSSKEGAVIGAVLSTRKFHRGHNCLINEITNKLKQNNRNSDYNYYCQSKWTFQQNVGFEWSI
jgi:hypothetical protein